MLLPGIPIVFREGRINEFPGGHISLLAGLCFFRVGVLSAGSGFHSDWVALGPYLGGLYPGKRLARQKSADHFLVRGGFLRLFG